MQHLNCTNPTMQISTPPMKPKWVIIFAAVATVILVATVTVTLLLLILLKVAKVNIKQNGTRPSEPQCHGIQNSGQLLSKDIQLTYFSPLLQGYMFMLAINQLQQEMYMIKTLLANLRVSTTIQQHFFIRKGPGPLNW